MKLKIKFKSIKQGKIYLKTIQIEEETLVEIITSGIIPKLFKEEQRIEKKIQRNITNNRNRRYRLILKKYKYVE